MNSHVTSTDRHCVNNSLGMCHSFISAGGLLVRLKTVNSTGLQRPLRLPNCTAQGALGGRASRASRKLP